MNTNEDDADDGRKKRMNEWMNEEPSNKMMIFHHVCNRSLTRFFGKSNIELSFLSAGDKGKKIEFSIAHIDYEFFFATFLSQPNVVSFQFNSIQFAMEVRFIFFFFLFVFIALALSHFFRITNENHDALHWIQWNAVRISFFLFIFSFSSYEFRYWIFSQFSSTFNI